MLKRTRILISENKQNTAEYEETNKTVRRMAKEDIRKYKTKLAQKILEENKGMKIFRRQTNTKKEITKLINKDDVLVTDRNEMLNVVTQFYEDLYNSKVQSDVEPEEKRRKITNVNSEDIPPINKEEIYTALKQIKNGKAAGEDEIAGEMLKEGGEILIAKLEHLFNRCLLLEVP